MPFRSSLFYLKWIDKRRMGSGGGWMTRRGTPAWRAWSGMTFESVCMKHVAQLKHALGIAAVETTESTWLHRPRSDDEDGAQIDLLIDRKDGCINVCEMKLTDDVFTIDKRYAADLRRKLSVFRQVTATSKALLLTMITSRGVRPNRYAKELVAGELILEDLFHS